MPPFALSARNVQSGFCMPVSEKVNAFALHMHIVASEKGLETEITIANYLVSLFIDSGKMCYAQQIVDKLPRPDAHSWNTLILGYSRNVEVQEALIIYDFVERAAIVYLHDYALLALLKASAVLNDLASGIAIHSHLVSQGALEENPRMGCALVDMYAKCGSIDEACHVFAMLLTKDVVIWTAMIAGFVECKLNEEAFLCFEKMQNDGIYADCFSFASTLKACGRLCDLDKGHKLYTEIITRGFEESDSFIGSGLVDMYARCGSLLEATAIFTRSQLQNVVSWTTLITAFVKSCYPCKAIQVFEMMGQGEVSPTIATFVCILKSCAAVGNVDVGLRINDELVKRGYEKELTVANSLIDMYTKCGFVEEGQQEFEKLSLRNVVSFNALLAGYSGQGNTDEVFLLCNLMDQEGILANVITFSITLNVCSNIKATFRGQQMHMEITKRGLLSNEDNYVGNALIDMYSNCCLLEDAWDVLRRLSVQDVISWTAIIQGYVEYECEDQALTYFEKMEQARIVPSIVTYVCCLRACGTVGALLKGQEIHIQIVKKGLETVPHIGNCFVYLYAKCGMLAAAEQLFFSLQDRDIVSCNALITGYAQLGKIGRMFFMLNIMMIDNILPDPVTFVCLLNAFSHEGEVAKGWMLFEAMIKYSGLTPSFNHYACIIDLYGRSGNVDVANLIINSMPIQPAIIMWHTIMAASKKWGDVFAAEVGFEQALQIDENDDSSYLYMFNIYVDAELPEKASQIDHLRHIKRKWTS